MTLKQNIFSKKSSTYYFPAYYFTSNTFNILELLPYATTERYGAKLKSGLLEYKMLIVASLQAAVHFERLELNKFDALVGENACQIRAVWVSIIAKNKFVNTQKLISKLSCINTSIERLLEFKEISTLMSLGTSLNDVLEEHNLDLFLDFAEFFIIQCFLLAEAKSADYNSDKFSSLFTKEKCEPKKLKQFGDISSSFAKSLVSKLRKNISQLSVDLVRKTIIDSDDSQTLNFLSEDFIFKYKNQLLCTPMFWTYKSILLAAKTENIDLILKVRFVEKTEEDYEVIGEDVMCFQPTDESHKSWLYSPAIHLNASIANRPSIVVQGVAYISSKGRNYKEIWRNKILNSSVDTIILAGAADHRQYPCPEQNRSFDLIQDHEHETYKSIAHHEGFSLANPSTFFIQHVYPHAFQSS